MRRGAEDKEMTAIGNNVLAADEYLQQLFSLEEKDWSQYSPLPLAYIGDSVFDVIIRTVIVKHANMQTAKMHRKASSVVNAGTQAKIADALQPYLREDEAAIYRRGKNSKPLHSAKNAAHEDYLKATGFEALIGYLYLKREYVRLLDLVKLGLKLAGIEL